VRVCAGSTWDRCVSARLSYSRERPGMSLEGVRLARASRSADDSRVRPELPTGTVTFVFTDVEGSTSLLNSLGADPFGSGLSSRRQASRKTIETRSSAVDQFPTRRKQKL